MSSVGDPSLSLPSSSSSFSASTTVQRKSVVRDERGDVSFDTSLGQFTIELYWHHTPKACQNFRELCKRGYYDNTIFHRLVPGFIIQGGDPTGSGRGGESIFGKQFEDEITRQLKHTGAGIVSMANAGPNTQGSQFFITLGPTPSLDGKHTIFGRIATGMGAVKKMSLVSAGADERPITEIKIHKACVVEKKNI